MRQARSLRRVGELVDVIDAGDKVVVIMRPPSEEGEQAALNANLTKFREARSSRWSTTRTPKTRSPPRATKRRAAYPRRWRLERV